MKKCSKCKQIKTQEEFRIKNKKTGSRQSWCIECVKTYQRNKYKTNEIERNRIYKNRENGKNIRRAYIKTYLKENPCKNCGEKDITVLEFHHIKDKITEVSKLICLGKLDMLKEEIKKCEVLCANCHKRKTSKEFNWYK